MPSLKQQVNSILVTVALVEGYAEKVIPGSGAFGVALLGHLKQLRKQVESLGENDGSASNV